MRLLLMDHTLLRNLEIVVIIDELSLWERALQIDGVCVGGQLLIVIATPFFVSLLNDILPKLPQLLPVIQPLSCDGLNA